MGSVGEIGWAMRDGLGRWFCEVRDLRWHVLTFGTAPLGRRFSSRNSIVAFRVRGYPKIPTSPGLPEESAPDLAGGVHQVVCGGSCRLGGTSRANPLAAPQLRINIFFFWHRRDHSAQILRVFQHSGPGMLGTAILFAEK